jgi:hypothetical protein
LSSSSSRCSSIAVGVLPKLFDAFFLSPSSHPATAGEVHSPLTPPKRLHPASFVRENSDACASETVAPPSFWRLEGDGRNSGLDGERGFAGGKEGKGEGEGKSGAMGTEAATSSSSHSSAQREQGWKSGKRMSEKCEVEGWLRSLLFHSSLLLQKAREQYQESRRHQGSALSRSRALPSFPSRPHHPLEWRTSCTSPPPPEPVVAC